MRNIVLRQDMAKLRVALGFDKWSTTGKAKGGRGGYIGADDVAMEKHIAHLEDDLYHAQQTALWHGRQNGSFPFHGCGDS